jgi:hypothetical protein
MPRRIPKRRIGRDPLKVEEIALRHGKVHLFGGLDEAQEAYDLVYRDLFLNEMRRQPTRLSGPCWALQHLERDPEVIREVAAAQAAATKRRADVMALVHDPASLEIRRPTRRHR